MTNQEIIKKAIEKASKNGFKLKNKHLEETSYGADYNIFSIIFSHDFAKALFGEEIIKMSVGDSMGITHQMLWKSYLYELQQMVISEDPIKYLGQYV